MDYSGEKGEENSMKYIVFTILLLLATPVEGLPIHVGINTVNEWQLTIPGGGFGGIELYVVNQPLDNGYSIYLTRAFGAEDIVILSRLGQVVMLLNLGLGSYSDNIYRGTPTGMLRFLDDSLHLFYVPDSIIPVDFSISQYGGRTIVNLDLETHYHFPSSEAAPEPSTLLLLGSTLILIGRKILRIAR